MFQKDSALAQWYRTRTALVLAFDDAEVAVTLHRAWLSRRGRRMGPPPRNFADARHHKGREPSFKIGIVLGPVEALLTRFRMMFARTGL